MTRSCGGAKMGYYYKSLIPRVGLYEIKDGWHQVIKTDLETDEAEELARLLNKARNDALEKKQRTPLIGVRKR